jgi:hypothetical protein
MQEPFVDVSECVDSIDRVTIVKSRRQVADAFVGGVLKVLNPSTLCRREVDLPRPLLSRLLSV